MTFTVTTAQMTDAELCAESNGVTRVQLMKNAAKGCLKFLKSRYSNIRAEKFAIICGKGNNGGDGVELANLLTENGGKATVILTDQIPDSEVSKACRDCHNVKLNTISLKGNEAAVRDILSAAGVIIDCVFGAGFHGELPSEVGELFDFVKTCKAYKIAVDIPSGINGFTGEVSPHRFKANTTLVLGAMKTGLLNSPATEYCGEMKVIDIGIADSCYEKFDGILTDKEIIKFLPKRPKSANKGTFGKLLNVAGGGCYIGAALLSSKAALRIGTGLVTLASTKKVIAPIASSIPECVFLELPKDKEGFISDKALEKLEASALSATAITVGCGMGNRAATRKITESLLKKGNCPVILDADGINSAADNINILKDSNRPIILTPHPGEFARLLHRTVKEVESDRLNLARAFAAEHGVILLLKGSNTIIAAPDGKVMVNTTGSNALSKAGCGDVLTGIIGGLAAQGMEAFDAAVLGAYIHGLSADLLIKEQSPMSVLASEVADNLKKIGG